MGEVQKAFPYYPRMSRAYLNMRHRRMAAMVLSKESWEMGELLRLSAERSTARTWAEKARPHLIAGLQLARQTSDGGIMLRVLAVVAHYFEVVGDSEQVEALAALVVQHPISWRENRELTSVVQKRAALAEGLADEVEI